MSEPLVKLEDLEKMVGAVAWDGKAREFRGAPLVIHEVFRLLAPGKHLLDGSVLRGPGVEVFGYPVVVDERCAPGYLYFGTKEEFERQHERLGDPGCAACGGEGMHWRPVMSVLCGCVLKKLLEPPRWGLGPARMPVLPSARLDAIDGVIARAEEE